MVFNIIFGAIIPWIIIFFFFKKYPEIVMLIFPLGISIAYLANEWGFYLFWVIEPIYKNPTLSIFPANAGYFPLLAISFSYFKIKHKTNNTLLILIYTIATTSFEYLMVLFGKVVYLGGWNIFLTSLIYLTSFIITSLYINTLYKYRIIMR
ncbi:hypothetical protein [Halobacillus massiliensis]|uniref:hypothetical protein n=1 Tax=Halobacillus massiliensis TaxID=1926286 RepID=UPI0009E59AD5|nr:hypothetical protein [Halobacillus massiliensis]